VEGRFRIRSVADFVDDNLAAKRTRSLRGTLSAGQSISPCGALLSAKQSAKLSAASTAAFALKATQVPLECVTDEARTRSHFVELRGQPRTTDRFVLKAPHTRNALESLAAFPLTGAVPRPAVVFASVSLAHRVLVRRCATGQCGAGERGSRQQRQHPQWLRPSRHGRAVVGNRW
jgi:hypothetical protein